jgi:epoxyqueuosine reductase QueG
MDENTRRAGAPDGHDIRRIIREYAVSPANTNGAGEPSWGEPLVGFADGDDELFERIRAHVGEFYWTPRMAFARACPAGEPDPVPEHLTVVSWVLPQTPATMREHAREDHYPSEGWVRSRKFGEDFNNDLHRYVVRELAAAGVRAVAPTELPDWGNHVSEGWGLATNWSHRHVAYVAGLGTFGLCDGLITAAGKAHRCGSVVMEGRIPPTERPYDDIHAYCLHYARGTCGACMARCPADALTPDGHDKQACRDYVAGTTQPYAQEQFGIYTYGCGLCQARVPCATGIPTALRPEADEEE